MRLVVWEQGVLLFSILCHGVLLWRLWSQRLAGVYRYLTVFLTGEALQGIVVLPVNPRSAQYGWIYVLSTSLLNVLAYFVVLELYRLVLEDYPGIASIGRKAVNWCVGLAVCMSA